MDLKYILIIDSGIGGLSVFEEIFNRLPNANYIFCVDNKYAPLGNRSGRFLRKHIVKLINEINQKYPLEMVVLACNTLTIATIKYLRKKFELKIVGTEPNIKSIKLGEPTVALGTSYTIKHCKLLKGKDFHNLECPQLASMIDKNFQNLDTVIPYLEKIFARLKNTKQVILGCTHYFFVKEQIKKVLGNVSFVENQQGVANRVKYLYKPNGKIKEVGDIIIMQTRYDNKLFETVLQYIKSNLQNK